MGIVYSMSGNEVSWISPPWTAKLLQQHARRSSLRTCPALGGHGHRCAPTSPCLRTATAIAPVPAACETKLARPCSVLVSTAPPLPPSLTFRASPVAQAAWPSPGMEPQVVRLLPAPHSCEDTRRDAAQPLRSVATSLPTTLAHFPLIRHVYARSGPPKPLVFSAYQQRPLPFPPHRASRSVSTVRGHLSKNSGFGDARERP